MNKKMNNRTIKPIMMVLALLALTPSGVVGETLQHDANTEADEVIYDLVRNIGAFSKVETINESVRFDYLCGADTTNTLGDNCMANDVHMILYRTSLQNTIFDVREITVKNLGTPDDVDLEIYVCYPIHKTNTYPNQMEYQRQWKAKMIGIGRWNHHDVPNKPSWDELFVYVVRDNNGNDGDRTRISVEIEILDDEQRTMTTTNPGLYCSAPPTTMQFAKPTATPPLTRIGKTPTPFRSSKEIRLISNFGQQNAKELAET